MAPRRARPTGVGGRTVNTQLEGSCQLGSGLLRCPRSIVPPLLTAPKPAPHPTPLRQLAATSSFEPDAPLLRRPGLAGWAHCDVFACDSPDALHILHEGIAYYLALCSNKAGCVLTKVMEEAVPAPQTRAAVMRRCACLPARSCLLLLLLGRWGTQLQPSLPACSRACLLSATAAALALGTQQVLLPRWPASWCVAHE